MTQSSALLATSASTFNISGTGFNPSAAGNRVTLSSGTATIASATSTSLTVTLGGLGAPFNAGPLTAVITAWNGTSGAPVEVAVGTVVSITPSQAPLVNFATSLVINGTGFDPSPSGTSVQLLTMSSTIVSATPTSLTLALPAPPSLIYTFDGYLYAEAFAYGGSSGSVQVAEVVSAFSGPTGLALSSGFAFVADAGDNRGVTVCLVTAGTGVLTGCARNDVGLGYNLPDGIAASGNKVWITSPGNVTVCTLSAGALTACQQTGAGFVEPTGIALDMPNGKAYITDFAQNGVWTCQVSGTTGALSACVLTQPAGLTKPTAIALSGSNAYITLANDYTTFPVYKCTLPGFACTVAASGFYYPNGIAIASGYAYITNVDNAGRVSQCTVAAGTGLLTGCVTTNTPYVDPWGIAIDAATQKAYIAYSGDDVVNMCSVAAGTGNLTGCAPTGYV